MIKLGQGFGSIQENFHFFGKKIQKTRISGNNIKLKKLQSEANKTNEYELN